MAADAQHSRWWRELFSQVVVVLLALLAFSSARSRSWWSANRLEAFYQMVRGAVGTRSNLTATIARSVPIIVTGIAAAVALKTGLFNLGMEGQMVAGAMAGAIIATSLPGLPAWSCFRCRVIGASLAGGLWALPPAWWQVSFKVPSSSPPCCSTMWPACWLLIW